jgi:hypothetical protein
VETDRGTCLHLTCEGATPGSAIEADKRFVCVFAHRFVPFYLPQSHQSAGVYGL